VSSEAKRGSRFRGAGMALLAAAAMVATLPGRTHGLGLITEPLLAGLGLDRVPFACLNFWATLLGAAFCLPIGWLLDRIGTRIVLAGVLLKMGTYGFVRFAMPLFPDATLVATPYIAGLATVGIVYGALLALAQSDVKKLVAYSSVSHLGFVMLGLAAMSTQGVTGAMLQMLNHGISTGALFLLVGCLYERRHTRQIADFGGITQVMPWFAVMFLIVTMSSIGLPGTNGFVGEFLVLSGTFLADGPWDLRWYVAVAATGVILGAFYMLWMFQRVMFGPLKNEKNKKLTDLNLREWVVLTPLIVLIFVMGIKPQFIIDRMEPSIEAFRKVATTSRLPADDAEGRARIAEIRQRTTNAAEAK